MGKPVPRNYEENVLPQAIGEVNDAGGYGEAVQETRKRRREKGLSDELNEAKCSERLNHEKITSKGS